MSEKVVYILLALSAAAAVASYLFVRFEPEIWWNETEKSISVYVGEDPNDSGAYLYYDCGWSTNRVWETSDGNWGCGYSVDP